ncbi:hypothetical protein SEPCBS119000_006721 [Sporothrix epigloea]|uniref:DUF7924 domain-containing protein n=1 Tax=Sporothrix epigloea TaxID=1892477 RepID=A0ABP0E761_9PEZI
MNTGQSNNVSIAPQSLAPPASQAANITPTSQKTSPYDYNFDFHLEQFNIFSPDSTMQPDLAEIMSAMALPLPSHSDTHFSQDAFEISKKAVAGALSKHEMIMNVLPKILGDDVSEYVTGHRVIFGNCTPITDNTVKAAKPTIYDGVSPFKVHDYVLNELSSLIKPSDAGDKPVVPNFFVEVAGRDRSPYVAELQSRYYGAIGARAIHSLQNYGKQCPVYDGKAKTLSVIICGRSLEIYAHHITAPAMKGYSPNYHMTMVESVSLHKNLDTFIKGVTAFRNCRKLAKQWRDELTATANFTWWFPLYLTPSALDFVEVPASQSPGNSVENAVLVADDDGQ